MLAPRSLPGPSTPLVAAAGLSGGRRRRARSAGRGRKSACRRPCRSGRRSKTTSTRRAHTPNPCGTPARAGSGLVGHAGTAAACRVFVGSRRGVRERDAGVSEGASRRVGAASGGREPRRERAGETGSDCQRGDERARADRRTHRSRLPRDASWHHRGRRTHVRRGLARAGRETHRRTSRHRARGRGGACGDRREERLQNVHFFCAGSSESLSMLGCSRLLRRDEI